MRHTRPLATLVAAVTVLALAGSARAADDARIGLNLDLGFASAYVFRGWNVFQKDGQRDAHLLLAPGVTWSIFDTGLTLGYWGAFQLNGDNLDANVDAALGMEQDLFLTYTRALPADLTLTAGVAAYLYPAADEKVVGCSFPAYLEPSVGLAWSSVVTVGLKASYFLGLQDEPAVRDISYLYLNPTVSKSFGLLPWLGLDVSLGYGFKAFQEGNDGRSNVHDVTLGVALPIRPVLALYVKPSLGAAWTDVEGGSASDGFVVWGGLNVGWDF